MQSLDMDGPAGAAFTPAHRNGEPPPLKERSRRPEGKSGTAAERGGSSSGNQTKVSLAWAVFQSRDHHWQRDPSWQNLRARWRAWAEFYRLFLNGEGAANG